MKKICLALAVLLIAAAVTVVSAETITGSIYDPRYDMIDYSLESLNIAYDVHSGPSTWEIYVNNTDIRQYPTQMVLFNARNNKQTLESYAATENYRIYSGTLDTKSGSKQVGNVQIEYQKGSYNIDLQAAFYTVVVNIDWNMTTVNSLTPGSLQTFRFNGFPDNSSTRILHGTNSSIPIHPYMLRNTGMAFAWSEREYIRHYVELDTFEQSYTIIKDEYGINIDLIRVIDGKTNPSKIIIKNLSGELFYQSPTYIDIDGIYRFPGDGYIVELESQYNPGRFYEIYRSTSGTGTLPSDNTTVTVYVRNSQTGSLIANANLIISANVGGNFSDVVNRTVPSGIYSIDLQPTGGGLPNPDYYRVIVTADGYNAEMPYADITLDAGLKMTMVMGMHPIAGAPEDENKTFIDFYVRDLAANAISGATVNFGGYTLITNSAGYTMFEVDKNKTYSWTVSKSGYGSVTGNAVIGSNSRHTINTVLAPAVTPTTPTPIPTSTSISPTPTMTAPSGEPVSNWLEWFAAHFGMLLGGGAEIGKIFMWLCFSVPVGVYVGKESKAGAAGFVAGAGIVTLFFVLIGWVPIWLLVLLALIIGLLYSKVFNNSDNGGGR